MVHKTAKNNPVKLADIQMAARRALMYVNADYYPLSTSAQETFRATKDQQAITKIRIVLVNTLLGYQSNAANIDEIWDELPDTDINIVNWASLLTDGVGQDFIFVLEAHSDYQKQDYFPFRWSPWVRLLINDVFFYSTLTSTASYIQGEKAKIMAKPLMRGINGI